MVGMLITFCHNQEAAKRQNHYEIISRNAEQRDEEDEVINFLDVAQGLKCWKQCKSCSGKVFVGYVKIRVEISNESDQLLVRYEKFLFELFGTENIFVEETEYFHSHMYSQQSNRSYIFTVIVGNVPTQDDTENLLDEFVKRSTTAKQKIEDSFRTEEFYPYNFIFTKLKKNLEKFI